jgi:hypothetical protein
MRTFRYELGLTKSRVASSVASFLPLIARFRPEPERLRTAKRPRHFGSRADYGVGMQVQVTDLRALSP